jgi:hypothetical protein
VVYHGKVEWNIPTEFLALFEIDEALKAGIPNFKYLPLDISRHSDDEIKGGIILRVALLILKYASRPELVERLPHILGLIGEIVPKRTALEYLETVVRYLAKGTEVLSEEALAEALKAALPTEGGELMATLAEKWFNQGEKEGEIRGKKEGKKEGLLSVIETGLEL